MNTFFNDVNTQDVKNFVVKNRKYVEAAGYIAGATTGFLVMTKTSLIVPVVLAAVGIGSVAAGIITGVAVEQTINKTCLNEQDKAEC